jgi:DNA adenine methylase
MKEHEEPIYSNLSCQYCGESFDESNDLSEEGIWCNDCDGFTPFDIDAHNKFALFLEDAQIKEEKQEKQKISFNQRLSPLRYPGGKSRLIGLVYQSLTQNHRSTFVEPYAGGGSVGLSLLDAGVIQHLVLNDIDFGIYSLFKSIMDDHDWLIEQIESLRLSHEDFFHYRSVVSSGYQGCDTRSAAIALLVTNRLAYSGICKANALGGRNGTTKELLSRWNPSQLIKRIQKINAMKDKITLRNEDALQIIEEFYWVNETTLFVDPPYFEKGKQLYTHFYGEGDHRELSSLMDSLYQGMPGADMIVTYDEHDYIRKLYDHPTVKVIGRKYSI